MCRHTFILRPLRQFLVEIHFAPFRVSVDIQPSLVLADNFGHLGHILALFASVAERYQNGFDRYRSHLGFLPFVCASRDDCREIAVEGFVVQPDELEFIVDCCVLRKERCRRASHIEHCIDFALAQRIQRFLAAEKYLFRRRDSRLEENRLCSQVCAASLRTYRNTFALQVVQRFQGKITENVDLLLVKRINGSKLGGDDFQFLVVRNVADIFEHVRLHDTELDTALLANVEHVLDRAGQFKNLQVDAARFSDLPDVLANLDVGASRTTRDDSHPWRRRERHGKENGRNKNFHYSLPRVITAI